MFNRKESIIKAIKDNSIERETLALMVDFYVTCGKLTEEDKIELRELLYPTVEEEIEDVIEQKIE